jgi:hypothetical protein
MAYLSIPCVDAYTGKLNINKAIEVLFGSQISNCSEGHLEKSREDDNDAKIGIIWKCVYVQEITQVHFFDIIMNCIHSSILVNISYSDACVAPPGNTRYFIVLSNA